MSDSQQPAPKSSILTALLPAQGGAARAGRQKSALGHWIMAPFLPWAVAPLFPPLNHDAAAILFWAQRMIAGDRLYIDLIDVNPPMIFWLNLPPAWIAAQTGLSSALLFSGGVLLLILASLAYSARLLQRLHRDLGPVWQLVMPLAALFALLVYPAHSFGQREHILLICALPYLVATAARSDRRRVMVMTGDSAGSAALLALAVCLKPHFAVLPLLVEAWIVSRQGWQRWLRDPAPWTVAAIGILYLILARWLHPAYFASLPNFLAIYAAIEPGIGWRLLTGEQAPALAIGALAGGFFAFYLLPSHLAQALTLFVTATAIAGFLQAKGWDYHFLAARAGLSLLLVSLAASLIDRHGGGLRSGGRLAHAVAAGLTVVGLFALSSALSPPLKLQRDFANSQASRLSQLLSAKAPGEPVMWLTGGIYPQFTAMIASGNPMAGHYMSLWLLPALYRGSPSSLYRAPSEMSLPERALFDSLGDDLQRQRPRLILVYDANREGSFKERRFDYLDYARRNPDFARAFKAYTLLTEMDGWTIYRR